MDLQIPVIDISSGGSRTGSQLVEAVAKAMNFGEFINGQAQQKLLPLLRDYETDVNHFEILCHLLCIRLLRLFALGLKIDMDAGGVDWFAIENDAYNKSTDIRAGAHSDYGTLTLLFQRPGQPGLEILTPSSTWSPVPVNPPGTANDSFPPILVNIGDLMEFWTNGLLRSTVHRVVFPDGENQDRYSIAYFCHPLDDIEIEPVPSEMIRERFLQGDKGKEKITAQEYLAKRLRETYGWGKGQEASPRD
ncbi:MAG: hypothetical protein Q9217_000359 [Psora testacea]